MPSAHHTPALSPSRLALYRQCPALYRRRYIDGITDPPTIDMEYGQAIHHAVEALFLEQDAELVFLRELKQRIATLPNCDPADWLVPQGLRLLGEVEKLRYRGEPERKFLYAYGGFRIPFRGIIDLWDKRSGRIVDWKTTRRAWSEKTAETYNMQRVIYTQAIASEFHRPSTFQFIALGAYPGGSIQVIESTPTAEQIEDTFYDIHELYLGIEAEIWDCTCRDKHHEVAA